MRRADIEERVQSFVDDDAGSEGVATLKGCFGKLTFILRENAVLSRIVEMYKYMYII